MHSKLAVLDNINPACPCSVLWYLIYIIDEHTAYFATSDSEQLICTQWCGRVVNEVGANLGN